jgi:hypothetical protein
MRQLRLNINPREKKPLSKQRSGYDAHNLECARLILADPEHYPGIQLEWARAILAQDAPQGPRTGNSLS